MSAKYAYQPEPGAKTASARVDNINASFKDLANVCGNVRGRRADKALVFLDEAAEKKRPVRYFNYNKRRGHVAELGGKKGGWPVKSVKIVRDVLKNAMANADAKNLGDCKVKHVQANKQMVYGRMSPKGRRIRHDLETAFVEIVLVPLQAPAAGATKMGASSAKPKGKPASAPAAKAEGKPAPTTAVQTTEQNVPAKTEQNVPVKTETPKTATAAPVKN
ncbi:MAG: 50S ribosomal protein L22 [Candidatus Micrarchaeota archaeon]|nr:50S ribosomal protein L22 [Candidatus Micrarchaeota archaeon]